MRDEMKCYAAIIALCERYTEMSYQALNMRPAWKFRQIYNFNKKLREKYNHLELSRIYLN